MISDTTTSDLYNILASQKPLLLLDVWAPWCPPCAKMHENLVQLKHSTAAITILRLNADTASDFITKHSVKSVPSLFLFKEGFLVSKKSGALSFDELQKWVSLFL